MNPTENERKTTGINTAARRPELLSPAGSPAALAAAIEAGADAVYLGSTGFNARAGAVNFDHDALRAAVRDAHAAGVRVYLTLNTIVWDREMRDFLAAAEDAYLAGADALIVADLGGAAALSRTFPDLPLHASTQMSGHNVAAARRLAAAGFTRMVLARELSCGDIAEFTENAPIEAEVFVHGALCVCHSGQCLFSSVVGGRSGNRGECAQPCRLPYTTPSGKGYPLSLKDLCLAVHQPELARAGVASYKIEGRMKPPEYVGAVTRVWRRLIDENRAASPDEMRLLADVFSRSGFTDAYFTGNVGREMLGTRTDADKARTATAIPPGRKDKDKDNDKVATGASSSAPARKPISVGLRVPHADGYVPMSPSGRRSRTRTAQFFNPWQLTNAAAGYFDLTFIPLESYAAALRDGIRSCGVALPPVVRDSEMKQLRRMLLSARESGATDALVGNIGHIDAVLGAGLVPHGDFRLNIANGEAAAAAEAQELADFILSPELTLPRIRDIFGDSRVIVYGRLPLMVTEKCVGCECGACRGCDAGRNALVDRMGKRFPVLRAWPHRSVIVNCLPTYMGDGKAAQALAAAHVTGEHFIFTTETPREVETVIKAYKKGEALPISGGCRRIALK